MWYAWDTDGLISDTDDNYKPYVAFKTKRDLMWICSCNYEDGRKRPTVRRIANGYYEYTPRDCDGQWRDTITIINSKYIDQYKFRKLFDDLLCEFKLQCKEFSIENKKV